MGGIALAVPFTSAWAAIITRQARHLHYSVLVFWFSAGGLVVALVGFFAFDTKGFLTGWDVIVWSLVMTQSLLGTAGTVFMTKAVCWLAPSMVMTVRSIEVLFSYATQVIIFGTTLDIYVVLGGIMLIL